MTHEEVKLYWMKARNKHFNQGAFGLADSKKLAELLGLPYPYSEYYFQIKLTPELRRVFEGLAGSHGYTIRKMLEARKRVENDSRGS